MSHSSRRRPPTPFHHAGSRSDDWTRSTEASLPSRSPASSAISSWIDEVSSKSSSPNLSQRVITGSAPPFAATPSPHPFPPQPFPILAYASATGDHTSAPPPSAPYASPPPASDRGSVSSRRTSSSAHTRSSTRDHQAERGGYRAGRALDTVPCQICLEPATVCTCTGDKAVLLKMREAAQDVFNGAGGAADSASIHSQHYEVPRHVAPQSGGMGYEQEFGYPAGNGVPVSYAGSSVSAYSGQAAAMGGYGAGYYGSQVVAPSPQTSSRSGGQQDVLGPSWGVRRG